jgi:hypothetical protein
MLFVIKKEKNLSTNNEFNESVHHSTISEVKVNVT